MFLFYCDKFNLTFLILLSVLTSSCMTNEIVTNEIVTNEIVTNEIVTNEIVTFEDKYKIAEDALKKGIYSQAWDTFSTTLIKKSYYNNENKKENEQNIDRIVALYNRYPYMKTAITSYCDAAIEGGSSKYDFENRVGDFDILYKRKVIDRETYDTLISKINNKILGFEDIRSDFVIKKFHVGMAVYQFTEVVRSYLPPVLKSNRIIISNTPKCYGHLPKICSNTTYKLFDGETEIIGFFDNNTAFMIKFTFKDYNYIFVKKGIYNKYGQQKSTKHVVKSNAYGAKSSGEETIWETKNEIMTLSEVGSKREESSLTLINKKKMKQLNKEKSRSGTYNM